jgi:hypothetical protein
MRISEQAKIQMLRLIDEGSSIHPFDLEGFNRWMQATYEALQSDSLQQQRFDEYCRSSRGVTSSKRLRCGVSMLKQALYKDAP